MITSTNIENFPQYKSAFYLIVEQKLAFTSRNNLARKVKNLSRNLTMTYVIDNSHMDR